MSEQESDFALSCIHDNPSTWRREVWLDGRKIASFCWTLFDRDDIARKTVPFYCPIAPFKPDQIWGDAKAMYPYKAPPSPGGWQKNFYPPKLRRIPDADDPRVLRRVAELMSKYIDEERLMNVSMEKWIDEARRELESEGSDDQAR